MSATTARTGCTESMDDVIYLALFVAMMTASFGYVRLCDRIVGTPDDRASSRSDDEVTV
jgi:hypothetical protein